MLAGSELRTTLAFAGDGYLANVSPSDFTALYEEALPVSISGREWLAAHDEHWDAATQVIQSMPASSRAKSAALSGRDWLPQSLRSRRHISAEENAVCKNTLHGLQAADACPTCRCPASCAARCCMTVSLWQVDTGTIYLIRQPTGHPIHENWRVELFGQLLMLPSLGPEQLKLLGEIMYQVLTPIQSHTCSSHDTCTVHVPQLGRPVGF